MDNYADSHHFAFEGGGVFADQAVDLFGTRIENCVFSANSVPLTSFDPFAFGYGDAIRSRSFIYVTGCVFTNHDQVAVLFDSVGGEISDCLFHDNYVGVLVDGSSVYSTRVKNCAFAGHSRCGICSKDDSYLYTLNSTFYNNEVGMLNHDCAYVTNVSNSIFWQNQNHLNWRYNRGFSTSFCSLATDPLFAAAESLDFHLKSAFGRWDPAEQEWKYDAVTSPCIDAGDPGDAGWHNELWPHGGRINMGAYGGTPEASMPSNPVGNTADVTHDDTVDLADWSLWSHDWLKQHALLDSDFDRDGDVDLNDLAVFAEQWLRP